MKICKLSGGKLQDFVCSYMEIIPIFRKLRVPAQTWLCTPGVSGRRIIHEYTFLRISEREPMNVNDATEPALSKSYDPSSVEKKWYDTWMQRNIFRADSASEKPAYSILMPPPNVTGSLTMGHVLNNTIQDIYIRWNRMRGAESCWFPGIDHAGIATQTRVEKEIAKEKLTRHDLGREGFLERVAQWKEQYGGLILKQLRSLGVSPDWERTLYTMDESASNAVYEVFIRLFDEGLIYRGKRIINWSPVAQSAISDEEVNFREVQEHIYTLRYQLEDGSGTLLVATVRPETIFGDVAVAVNPEDERYKHLIGKNVRVPLAGQLVPIIADNYADPAFGTGVVKITPAHDPNDFEVGTRHNLPMPNTMNPDGTLNELTGEFKGLERFVARKRILEKLQELELVDRIEDYTHNVGFTERGGEPVEPYLSDQWFVRMQPLAVEALKVVQEGKIRFFPDHHAKVYEHWMTNIRDWCISRQLWWGHRIPVYYTEDGNCTAARSEEDARKKLNLPEGTPLRQDEDVLDTWFSSWLWPMTTMGWLADGDIEETTDLKKFLPSDLLVTGPDIIFFWVARMIMATLKFKGMIPFRDVYFTSMIRDAKGRKMSKSLGNSPDPLDIIGKYGADAVRFTMIHSAPIGLDIRLTVNEKTQDIETMDLGRNFANKIWNAGRFLMMKRADVLQASSLKEDERLLVLQPSAFELSDLWITSRFHATAQDAARALQSYRLTDYSKRLYEFIWNDFCDWYVEIIKIRIQNSSSDREKIALVNYALGIFDGVLRLLHPVMPFLTEELWHAVTSRSEAESISTSRSPLPDESFIRLNYDDQFRFVQSVIEEIRGLRGLMNIPPHEKLPVTLACHDADVADLMVSQGLLIKSLARVSELVIAEETSKPAGAVASVVQGVEIYVTMRGFINFAAERERLSKEVTRLEGQQRAVEGKLNNEKFVANAPADIVAYEREKLVSMKDTIQKLQTNISYLAEE